LNYGEEIGYPTPVGIYPRGNTPEGICDLAGNVWEWCQDAWDKKYYQRSPRENPSGPETGSSRVLRGGGWVSNASLCRSACRLDNDAAYRDNRYGFRLVRLCDLVGSLPVVLMFVLWYSELCTLKPWGVQVGLPPCTR
jgi:formylglycine-generating enzyme required for sulfatase activity